MPFFELDLKVQRDKLNVCRSHLFQIQQELHAPCMIIVPFTMHEGNDLTEYQIRVMLSLPYSNQTRSSSFALLKQDSVYLEGQLIAFNGIGENSEVIEADEKHRLENAQSFLDSVGLDNSNIIVIDGEQARANYLLAGYCLHPLFSKLVPNNTNHYLRRVVGEIRYFS